MTQVSSGGSSQPHDIADPDAELVVYSNEERYDTKTTLGEGGMGEVLLCTDRVIGREVAKKIVLATHDERPEIRARFVREARVQGQLEHPAIVPVYDFGVDASGRAFFTMKRIRGVTLEAVLDSLRRKDEAAARAYTRHKLLAAFVQACLAIDYAHARGVLHRDIKPANIMLGGYGEVYVVDWGLAKVRSASLEDAARISERKVPVVPAEAAPDKTLVAAPPGTTPATVAGSLLGTPGYMAPESIRGEEADNRTDVYALGAILFEILTLEPLHGQGPVAQMMMRALEGVESKPSVRTPEREIPPELDAICALACARGRDERIASARELADSVEAYLSGDRDVALRKELARVHLERARDAATRSRVPGASLDEQRLALREVGRAMALAPDDTDVQALFVDILDNPPKTPPPELLEILDETSREAQRRILPRAALAYSCSMLLFFPLQVLIGIRSWKLTLVPLVLWMTAGALAWVAYKKDHTGPRVFPYVTLAAAIALAATSLLHGPLLVVPAIGAVIAMGMALQRHPRDRKVSTALNLAAVLVPTGLAWAGLHPVGHEFVNGDMVIHPGALELPRDATFVILSGVHVLVIGLAAMFAGNYRDSLSQIELKSQMIAWQLRQLVPRDRLPGKD